MRAMTLVAVALAFGCTEASGPDTVNVAGQYTLVSYNDWAVPVQFTSAPGCTQEIQAGLVDLARSGTFTATITLQNACVTDTIPPSPVTVQQRGTYGVEGASLHLRVNGEPGDQPLGAADGESVSLDLRPYFGATTRYTKAP